MNRQSSPIGTGGLEKHLIETGEMGERTQEVPTPPDVQEFPPEAPKKEIPAEEIQVEIEVPREEKTEGVKQEPVEEERPSELDINDVENRSVNLVSEAAKLQDEIITSSME